MDCNLCHMDIPHMHENEQPKYMPVKAVFNNVMRREQIKLREDMLTMMGGTLYPGMIREQIAELQALEIKTRFTLVYFKPSGKWYTEEEVEWPEDPNHYMKYASLENVRPRDRLRGMICVALETPFGHPLMDNPHSDLLKDVDH